MPYSLDAILSLPKDDIKGDTFGVRPRGNLFPPASTPGPWYFIHFQKSNYVCTALLVKKITGGTAPRLGLLKAPDGIETAPFDLYQCCVVSECYSCRPTIG
jgi:hypothetical protein